jgi:hypothetical protein
MLITNFQVDALGLGSVANTNIEVQTYLRYLWALALVPEEQVVTVWEDFIKDTLPLCDDEDVEEDPEAASEFNLAIKQLEVYFEATWVGVKQTRTGKQRKKPRYTIDLWNHFEALLADDDITTNLSESWNAANKLTLAMKPNLWSVNDSFKREEAGARAKIVSSSTHSYTDPIPGRTAKRAAKRAKLKAILGRFKELPIKDYMNMLIAHFNDD